MLLLLFIWVRRKRLGRKKRASLSVGRPFSGLKMGLKMQLFSAVVRRVPMDL
jgi:hypothetical protein